MITFYVHQEIWFLPKKWPVPSGVSWPDDVLTFTTLPQDSVTAPTANGTMACIWELLDREGGAQPTKGFDFPQ